MKRLTLSPTTQTYRHPKNIAELQKLPGERDQARRQLGFPPADTYFRNIFRNQIASLINEHCLSAIGNTALHGADIDLGPVPPKFQGDYAVKIPKLMQANMGEYTKSFLPAFCQALEQHGKQIGIIGHQATGPFLNISLQAEDFLKKSLQEIAEKEGSYGLLANYQGKRLCIDFSSPNMGKALHVGHVTTNFLGQAMSNLYEAVGYTVLRMNHLGDWGTPVGLLKVAVEEYSERPEIKALQASPAKYFSALYALINEDAKTRPELRDRARDAFSRLEASDPEMLKFWLDVREAADECELAGVVERVKESGLAREDGKALVLDFEAEKLGTVLVVKSDGTTTYMTRDIAAIKRRKEVFDLTKSVYVVGNEQALHFRQLFHVADKLGLMPKSSCVHIAFGLLTRDGKKISSRAGGALSFEDLCADVREQCMKVAAESLPDAEITEQQKVAAQVARAALYFSQAQNTPGKNAEFKIEEITNTKGKSGPSLQYACVRAQSILRKLGNPSKPIAELDTKAFENLDASLLNLAKVFVELPAMVLACAEQNSAHYLANYLDDLKMSFTTFIHSVVIREAEGDLRDLYLHMVQNLL
jgi:arginyl-tRNA synthetase